MTCPEKEAMDGDCATLASSRSRFVGLVNHVVCQDTAHTIACANLPRLNLAHGSPLSFSRLLKNS
jgi:hypothetical protein